jgi:hypothetical protein
VAILVDQKTPYTGSGLSSFSFNHTCGVVAHPVLLVAISVNAPILTELTSVSYGIQALTRGTPATEGSSIKSSIWWLRNPPSGTAAVSGVFDGLINSVVVEAISFYEVDQLDPIGDSDAITGVTDSIELILGASTDDLSVDCLASRWNVAATVGAGQTEEWQTGVGGASEDTAIRGAGSREAGAASVNMSWTVSGGRPKSLAALILNKFQNELPAGVLIRVIEDLVQITENPLKKAPLDTVQITDSVLGLVKKVRVITDSVPVMDSRDKIVSTSIAKVIEDNIWVSDSIEPIFMLTRIVNDTVDVSETLQKPMRLVRGITETVRVRSVGVPRLATKTVKTVFDTVSITENLPDGKRRDRFGQVVAGPVPPDGMIVMVNLDVEGVELIARFLQTPLELTGIVGEPFTEPTAITKLLSSEFVTVRDSVIKVIT